MNIKIRLSRVVGEPLPDPEVAEIVVKNNIVVVRHSYGTIYCKCFRWWDWSSEFW